MSGRFVLVDPSFKSHAGDRWQYAIDCAKSAHELGYEFCLLTHREAPSIRRHLPFAIDQRGIFDHTFYEHDKIYSRHWTRQPEAALRSYEATLDLNPNSESARVRIEELRRQLQGRPT